MKMYLAGISTVPEMALYGGGFLESYLYFQKKDFKGLIEKWKIEDLFLDSGAFSAYTIGREIDIKEYGNFILLNRGKINIYANLDVIGDAEATYQNWLTLKGMGLNPIPVIHYGVDGKWFDTYLGKHKEKYIALGGLVPYSMKKEKLKRWLDYSFSKIKPYFPIKVHLFGITTGWVLKRYPVYSCDSTGWLSASIYGRGVKFNGKDIIESKEERKKNKISHYQDNNIKSGLEYRKLENYITKIWEKKGIVWD